MSLLKSFKKNVSVIMCITLLFSLLLCIRQVLLPSSKTALKRAIIYGHPLVGIGLLLRTKATAYITSLPQKEGRTSAGDSAWSDYTVEADVKVVDFNGSNRTYVAGRYIDGNNFYAASLYNNNDGMLEIRKRFLDLLQL